MAKLPAFQFYPGDWLKDPGVQSLDYFCQGVWFALLCRMHDSEERGHLVLNGKAMQDEAIARLLGLDKQTATTTLTTLLENGVARRRESDGAVYSKRMVMDERLRQIRQTAGKQGGNPLLVKGVVKQKPTTGVKQKPTPSSSPSGEDGVCDSDVSGNGFVEPTVDEVRAYCHERKNAVDPEAFVAFYGSKGWMIGKNRMKDWRKAVLTWERNRDGANNNFAGGRNGGVSGRSSPARVDSGLNAQLDAEIESARNAAGGPSGDATGGAGAHP